MAHGGLPSKHIKTDDLKNRFPNATNVNKLTILLRTVHSIENMVNQALQNLIASSKIIMEL